MAFSAVATFAFLALPAAAQSPRSAIEISAKSRDSTPVPGVVIVLRPVGGQLLTLATDSTGRARAAGLEPGTVFLSVRKVGFRPGDIRAILGPGQNTIPLLLDPAGVPTLAEVRILGGREVLGRHAEFEGRRVLGSATASMTADDIRKRNPISTWQMLTNLPSVRIQGGVARSTRSICSFHVVVNGIPLLGAGPGAPANLDDLPPLSDVHGIEVFAGPASVPPQYNSSAGGGPTRSGLAKCGVIAIWTK